MLIFNSFDLVQSETLIEIETAVDILTSMTEDTKSFISEWRTSSVKIDDVIIVNYFSVNCRLILATRESECWSQIIYVRCWMKHIHKSY